MTLMETKQKERRIQLPQDCDNELEILSSSSEQITFHFDFLCSFPLICLVIENEWDSICHCIVPFQEII